MGHFLNPGNDGFAAVLKNDVYVDKTELIAFMNRRLGSSKNLVCSTRPRRFGKTFAAMMLSAYYSRGADSAALFRHLAIANPPATDPEAVREQKLADYRKHLNQYDVIFWDIVKFTSYCPDDINRLIRVIEERTAEELLEEFPGLVPNETQSLSEKLSVIRRKTGRKFLFLIDEWDVLLRESTDDALLTQYLAFLKELFTSEAAAHYLAGAYLTGILPLPRIDGRPALPGFTEISMISPGEFAGCVGFTEKEVKTLCEAQGLDFKDMQRWFDGYRLKDAGPVYNPVSVMDSIEAGACGDHWSATETHAALQHFIELPIDGLAKAVLELFNGKSLPVDPQHGTNIPWKLCHLDDVLTLLVHLGYLGFDSVTSHVFVPNLDVQQTFRRAILDSVLPLFEAAKPGIPLYPPYAQSSPPETSFY